MQALLAQPQVAAGLGVATAGAVPRSRGRIHGAHSFLSKSLMIHQKTSSCDSLSLASVPRIRSSSSGRIGFRNGVARAENLETEEEAQLMVKEEMLTRGLIDVDGLVQGQVGRIALVTTLLLGVGVATLGAAGNAEAATVHLRDGLHSSLDVDMRALAMGPEGPLLEEFWDNMRRYGLYFLTVASGGIYSLLKPAIDALRNPVTAVLVVIVATGSIYLVGLTVSAMLGINEYQYEYAP